MNLALAFAQSAERHLEKTAVFWGESQYTYGTVSRQARRAAAQFQKLGVQPGDRVGVWLKNCPEFITALFGIWNAGAVAVPINNFLKPYEVAFIIEDAGLDVLISELGRAEHNGELLSARPSLKIVSAEELAKTSEPAEEQFSPASRDEADLAFIVYTSGTTGRPKGAMLTHGNLLHNVDGCRQVLQAVSFDRFVVLLPMFHSFMLCVGILLPMLVGGSVVLVKSIHPPKNVIQEIIDRQATLLPAIPQFFRALANAPLPENLPLRLCVSGAAPLPLEVLKEFTTKVPVPLLEGYGLSEASPVVSMNPIQGPWKAGSIGLPIPNVEMSVQDESGRHLPVGETGEICVRGGNVMKGYWNRPDETARAMREGWLLTGDIGRRDADGYYYITDRKKDMLLVNGINVYPREIEEIIYQFQGVKEAAVIGVPDARKGEQPVAFVAPQQGAALDEKALLHFIRGKLADYKVPRRVVVMDSLPRNATGKILKTTLREMSI